MLLVILISHNILLSLILHVPGRGNYHQIETRWINIDSLTIFGNWDFSSELAAHEFVAVNHSDVGEYEDVGLGRVNSETCELAFYLILSYDKMI